jgi:hypothetical protein
MQLKEIREAVESYLGVDIRIAIRKKENVRGKRLFFYVARYIHKYSLYACAEELGLDHSSAYHHAYKFKQWVEFGDAQSTQDLYNCFGIDSTGDNAMERRAKTSDKFLSLLEKIPQDKHEDAYMRIDAMVKGYNQKHGDTITIINGFDSISDFIK